MTDRQQALMQICEAFNLEAVYVFGSRADDIVAWWDQRLLTLPLSAADVDVGVKPTATTALSVLQKARLAAALEDYFGVARVDLVLLSEADPFLAANIVRGARLYARDVYWADEYDLYVFRRAGDLAPFERERMALVLEKV